jgi:hypothetical protein
MTYSYDRTAASPKAFQTAVEKAFLAVSPELHPYEKGTTKEKAAKSFAENAAEAFEGALNYRIEIWVDKVATGKTKLLFRTLSTDTAHDSYTSEGYDGETHYYYDVDYPSVVQLRQVVDFNEDVLIREAVKRLSLDVELKDKREAETVLSHPEVRRAMPALLESHLKSYEAYGPIFGEIGEAAEQYIGRKMHVSPDSDAEDEYEMGVEGHIKIHLQDAEWKVVYAKALTLAIEVTYKASVEVLWPGDREYGDYY